MTGTTHQGGQPLLEVEGLSVVFDDAAAPAVDGVSWALHPGRVTALVGESGSGKTVSAMAVLGLLPDTARVAGSIRLGSPDGGATELVGASGETFRDVRGAVLSLVSQEPMSAWNPVLTVGEQVAEAVRAHRTGPSRLSRRAAHARVLELLAEAGLDDPARIAAAYPHQLSGGQLQRALVAMGLSQDPVAIVADEPTTALDVTVQAGILDLLRRLRDERGTAVLLITHDMGVVADLADDVVVMREGRVVEAASVGELFAAPRDTYTRTLLAAVPRLGGTAAGAAAAARPSRPEEAAVVLDGVTVTYGGRHPVVAADDVRLEIGRGEVLGLVGESGSGKSTLGQVVAGLLRPGSGRVVIDGVDVARASRRERAALRRSTGVVFQDPASTLNPRWTVAQSVGEPLRLHAALDAPAQETRVRELLDLVRLGPASAGRYPHELSGGQRQRVAIARAVALGPAVLVADEPTSALDVSVQAHVLDLFRDLQAELGFSCLFVSHDLAVVERVADRVAVLRSGRVVESGPTARVLREPADPYTRALVAAAPVPDPEAQAARRAARAGARA
ncbi:dipeptide ABC transporter ATP-binding protein [Promicromonospora citrea]|uniref:Putative oligopeptide ABC transporter, ATP-binding protein n=1 Tax=Promicromonospora citrea TaxID=43677 RepID=A0A8H9GQW6_9MICO|nr:ABC transporter ATP-binding protein [Promicromonospora citrea]NNH54684.1 ABC transporter ATP-binding protein [Promicromonospora citrea]GGM42659.1 putative oligopeptide ABC transporter, ATP-binding protein [Promicromonospora citrea]